MRDWLKQMGVKNSEEYLKKTNKAAYTESLKDDKGAPPRVIEAVGDGVIFTTIEHSAHCDSLAVLRPRLSKKDRLIALSRAFKYFGRPYDYDFDFLTDETLVCTELVYKAYEPTSEMAGLSFKLEKVLGRHLLPANVIAREFDKEYKTKERDLDFVLFYDGFEKKETAKKSNEDEFRKSWKRPKWHVFVQE
jgi:hypothetical protein